MVSVLGWGIREARGHRRLPRLPDRATEASRYRHPDTVSNGHVDLKRGLVSSLYNPYAAVPSMHVGYAVIVAASLLRHGRRRLVRTLGVLYPPFVLLVIVATGNHLFFDAAAGALVAALAATHITRPAATGRGTALPAQRKPLPPLEELAA